MGGILSRRVGSDPYYADYERVFKRLRAEIERLHVRLEHFVQLTLCGDGQCRA